MGGGRRRMKQMQGLLLLSRLDESRCYRTGKKPQRMTVVLQPQMMQLFYSSLADQDMLRPLGRIDLRDSKLEQVSGGFVIYEAHNARCKKVKLQDEDKATTDAWFLAVYTAITEYKRLPINADEIVGHKLSACLTSSIPDEHTEEVEYKISCQLVQRAIDKPSIKWTVWKTFSEFQMFDDELRISFGAFMTRIMFPRDRKRDILFGSMRKKSLQGVKEQQLALYFEQVCQMLEISTDSSLFEKVKQFLEFSSFYYEIALSSPSEDGNNDYARSDVAVSAYPLSEPPLPTSAFTEVIDDDKGPPLLHDKQSVGQSATEPVKSVSDPHLSANFNSTDSICALPIVYRRSSFAALEDEGDEFVEVIPVTDAKAARRLHKKIIQTVRELVSHDEERVQEFQDQAKDFGRDKISAVEYCAFLFGAVGASECCKVIPDMARLLPNEVKRAELMQARVTVWRRTHRRQRRRSKQISESVVLQKQTDHVYSKIRPLSDSCSILNWGSERNQLIGGPVRSSANERKLLPEIVTKYHSQLDCSAPNILAHRSGFADPRRHLNRRASFNTMFGETVQTDLIDEEHPADNESDDHSRPDRSRTLSNEPPSNDGKSPRNGNKSDESFGSGRCNSIFLYDDDDSTEDDEENHQSDRCRNSRNRQQSVSGSGSRQNRVISETPLSRVGLTLRSRQNCSFVAQSYGNDGEEENSNMRFCRSQSRASQKFDEDAKYGLAIEEENPVLARLKKQGAVNFMMQLN